LLLILVCNTKAYFLIAGKRDYLGNNDLRDKLDRRHLSPPRYSPARDARGYSPARDARGRQTIRG